MKLGGENGTYERVNVEEQEKISKKFRYTKDIQFGITDSMVIVSFENYNVRLEFEDSKEKVALFNRFLTDKKIYDGNYSAPKNVPAYVGASAGNKIKYARFFEQDGKVLLNYCITYAGKMINEDNYSKNLEFAISKIIEMVNVDTKMINENYKGNNIILYTGKFEIYLGNNKITDEKNLIYNKYLNQNVEFVTFTFEPNVVEINSNDLKYINDNLSKVTSRYDISDIQRSVGHYDKKYNKWITEYEIYMPKYDYYYSQLRYYYFEKHYDYYQPKFEDVYLTSNGNKLITRDELIDYLISDKEGLIQAAWNNNSEIWNYRGINRDVNEINVSRFGEITISFNYIGSYNDYETGIEKTYNTSYGIYLDNNSISGTDYSRTVTNEMGEF